MKNYCGKGKIKEFDNGGKVVNFWINKEKVQFNEEGFANLTLAIMQKPDEKGNEYTIYQWVKDDTADSKSHQKDHDSRGQGASTRSGDAGTQRRDESLPF